MYEYIKGRDIIIIQQASRMSERLIVKRGEHTWKKNVMIWRQPPDTHI